MRRLLRAAAATAATTAALLGLAGPASADGVAIRKVDTSAFPLVKVEVSAGGTDLDPSGLVLEEDGHRVAAEAVAPVAASATTVLVVDTSGSMQAGGKADQAKALARALVERRGAGEVAVVAAGQPATVVQRPTTDPAALARAIGALEAAGESHLHDAVRLGAGLLAGRGGSLVVVADGRDVGSTGTVEEARSTAISSSAMVLAVALGQDADLDRSTLRGLASATSGTYREVADPRALPGLAADLAGDGARRWSVSYRSTATGPFDLSVTAAGQRAVAKQVVPGGATAPGVKIAAPTASVGPLRSSTGAWIVAGVVFLAAAAAFAAIGLLVLPSRSSLDTTLEAYDLERTDEVEEVDDRLVKTAIVQRAVNITEKVARSRGLLSSVEQRLEQADLKLKAPEVVFFTLAAVAMVGLLGLAFLPPLGALLIVIVAAYLPFAVLGILATRRRKKFVSQLPDTLNLLAGTLRSGYALLQGISAIVAEVDDPMAGELRRVLVEAQLGRDLDDALAECAARMQSPDFEWAVMAIGIQREVGGNLAELLDTVADTMLQRERLRRDVAALTAEGKMSAMVLGGMPPGLGLLLFVLNREYVLPLLTTTMGNVMLGASGAWAVFGFWWMKKTITIDI